MLRLSPSSSCKRRAFHANALILIGMRENSQDDMLFSIGWLAHVYYLFFLAQPSGVESGTLVHYGGTLPLMVANMDGGSDLVLRICVQPLQGYQRQHLKVNAHA